MMSYMAVKFFRESPLLAYPLFALASFFMVYLAWLLRTALAGAARYEQLARLPLDVAARGPAREQNSDTQATAEREP